jgi:hypothetical protein
MLYFHIFGPFFHSVAVETERGVINNQNRGFGKANRRLGSEKFPFKGEGGWSKKGGVDTIIDRVKKGPFFHLVIKLANARDKKLVGDRGGEEKLKIKVGEGENLVD